MEKDVDKQEQHVDAWSEKEGRIFSLQRFPIKQKECAFYLKLT